MAWNLAKVLRFSVVVITRKPVSMKLKESQMEHTKVNQKQLQQEKAAHSWCTQLSCA